MLDTAYFYLFFSFLAPAYPGFSLVGLLFVFTHELVVSRVQGRAADKKISRAPWIFSTPPREEPARATPPKLKLIHGAERGERPAPKTAASRPDFSGQPHEVLCVPADADTKIINNAFRFWIKQFHPDKVLGELDRVRAQVHARQLREAREKLILRRRNNKMSA